MYLLGRLKCEEVLQNLTLFTVFGILIVRFSLGFATSVVS